MGVQVSPRMDHYWRQDLHQGPIHTPRLYMSLKRFEQIKRILRISRSTSADDHGPRDKRWWYKLEPLASVLGRAACDGPEPEGITMSLGLSNVASGRKDSKEAKPAM